MEVGMTPRAWLVKSEPSAFSFDDLMASPKRTTAWDGVRNYQARNFMRDDMRVGDPVLFYHSDADPPAVVGLAEVASEPYPDPSQFDAASPYFDPASTPEEPRWQLVDVRACRRLPRAIPLAEIKRHPELRSMEVARRGSRLSVMPVEPRHVEVILALAEREPS
jgi:predicted RNA-binding protein with PUA-like domain